jgi:predicted ester cyclase
VEERVSVNDNRVIARSAFEALMAGNLTPLDDLLAPDCILHQCGWLQPIRGAERIKHVREGRQLVSDRHVRLDTMVAEGNTVAIHWHTSGEYADAQDQARVGHPVSFMSMSFLRLEGGKIQEIWNIQDMSTLWAQLGSDEQPSGIVVKD